MDDFRIKLNLKQKIITTTKIQKKNNGTKHILRPNKYYEGHQIFIIVSINIFRGYKFLF